VGFLTCSYLGFAGKLIANPASLSVKVYHPVCVAKTSEDATKMTDVIMLDRAMSLISKYSRTFI
jgi:hypothetical protein